MALLWDEPALLDRVAVIARTRYPPPVLAVRVLVAVHDDDDAALVMWVWTLLLAAVAPVFVLLAALLDLCAFVVVSGWACKCNACSDGEPETERGLAPLAV